VNPSVASSLSSADAIIARSYALSPRLRRD
jgi:hypothetical protein